MDDNIFTPGPWQVVHYNGKTAGEIAIDGDVHHRTIALVSQARDEWLDNARLIAAAPDLYAACEAAETYFGGSVLSLQEQRIAGLICTALSKARGAA